MPTTRHSFTSIATALAMAAALIAAMGPRVEAEESDLEYEIEVEWFCDEINPDWDPQLQEEGTDTVDFNPDEDFGGVSHNDILFHWSTGVNGDCDDIEPNGTVEVTLVSVELLDSDGKPVEPQPAGASLPYAGAGFSESISIWDGGERTDDSPISISVPPSAAEGKYEVRIKVEWTPGS